MNVQVPIFDDLVISTLGARMKEINMKSLSRKSLTLAMLQKNAVYESGNFIQVKFRKDRFDTGNYRGSDQRSIRRKEIFAGGQIDWRNSDVRVSIDEETLVRNSGLNFQKIMAWKDIRRVPSGHMHTLFDIFALYHVAALEDLDEFLALQIHGDGFGQSSESGNMEDIAIEGFKRIMNPGQPYAGLDPFANDLTKFNWKDAHSQEQEPIWDVKHIDLEGKRIQLPHLSNLASSIRRGMAKMTIYVSCPEVVYNYLEATFEGDKMRAANGGESNAIELGFADHIYFPRHGLVLYPEHYNEAYEYGDKLAGTLFGWNPDYLQLVRNKDLAMQFGGTLYQTDRYVLTYSYKEMCNLRCSDRAKMFRIDNVGVA
jgi:hypothetical protein